MSIPDFFIIGAPKCGTTTLYDWLRQHPQVHAPHKEPGFFSQDLESTAHQPTHISTLEVYESIFASGNPNIRVSGEATPRYLYSDAALDQIARLRPDAKIIICLRDPVDLAISFHNQKVREGVESETDFARAWARGGTTDNAAIQSMEPWLDGRINYAFWAAYGRRLEQVFARFPCENIRIYTIPELKQAPRSTFRDICRFLDISENHQIALHASNTGYRMRSARLHLAVIAVKRRMHPVLRLIASIRGREGLGVMQWIQRFNRSSGSYGVVVPAALKEEMKRSLAADRELAQRFLKGKHL